jgi:diacylglycerol kinase (ATP)
MKDNYAKFSIRKRLASFKYAFSGLGSLIKHEHNARLHLLAALLVIAMGFILGISRAEWMILVIIIAMVFITEILNSAIESLADFVSPQYSEIIKRVKDYCAAAVLIAAITSVVVGLIIFLPKVIQILFSSNG